MVRHYDDQHDIERVGSRLVIASQQTLYVSENEGDSWINIGSYPDVEFTHLHHGSENTLYAFGSVNPLPGTYKPFFLRTSDAASTWESVPIPEDALAGGYGGVGDILWITHIAENGYLRVTDVSTDGGQEWRREFQSSSQPKKIISVVPLSEHEAYAVAESSRLMYTNDAGKHWINPPLADSMSCRRVFRLASGQVMVISGKGDYAVRSVPDSTWVITRRDPEGEKFLLYNDAVVSSDTMVFCSDRNGALAISDDRGKSYRHIALLNCNGVSVPLNALLLENDQLHIVGGNGFYRKIDLAGGDTVVYMEEFQSLHPIRSVGVGKDGWIAAFDSYNHVYISSNGGDDWCVGQTEFPITPSVIEWFDGSEIWVSSGMGPNKASELQRLDTLGHRLVRYQIGVRAYSFNFKTRSGALWFIGSGQAMRTEDNGVSWQQIHRQLDNRAVDAGVIDGSDRIVLWCTQALTDSTELWLTEDNGSTFTQIPDPPGKILGPGVAIRNSGIVMSNTKSFYKRDGPHGSWREIYSIDTTRRLRGIVYDTTATCGIIWYDDLLMVTRDEFESFIPITIDPGFQPYMFRDNDGGYILAGLAGSFIKLDCELFTTGIRESNHAREPKSSDLIGDDSQAMVRYYDLIGREVSGEDLNRVGCFLEVTLRKADIVVKKICQTR